MLKPVAKGVLVHESRFCRSNAVVVQGKTGALLIDAGITTAEMAAVAADLRELGQPVVAGFSTHPHWDHVLWHAQLGSAPRYATARGATAIQQVLSNGGWRDRVRPMLPPDLAGQIPLDGLFGQVTGLPAGATEIPWDGPKVRIIEHQAHATGHAALLIEDSGVLVAGDMFSDLLIPILNFMSATDPVEDYLAGLKMIEDAAGRINAFVPGHGSTGGPDELRARLAQDRAYVGALRDGAIPDDPRLRPSAPYEWGLAIHERQLQQLAQRPRPDGTAS